MPGEMERGVGGVEGGGGGVTGGKRGGGGGHIFLCKRRASFSWHAPKHFSSCRHDDCILFPARHRGKWPAKSVPGDGLRLVEIVCLAMAQLPARPRSKREQMALMRNDCRVPPAARRVLHRNPLQSLYGRRHQRIVPRPIPALPVSIPPKGETRPVVQGDNRVAKSARDTGHVLSCQTLDHAGCRRVLPSTVPKLACFGGVQYFNSGVLLRSFEVCAGSLPHSMIQ